MIDHTPVDLAPSPALVAGPGAFWLNYRTVAQELLVTVVGELDMVTEHVLVDAVGAATADTRPVGVRVDLSGVRFIDARGVAALVDCVEVAGASGARFEITCASLPVRQVLEIVQLAGLLTAT